MPWLPRNLLSQGLLNRCLLGLAFALLPVWSQAASGQARLAIIIDDIGYNLALGRRAADLQGDFTLAVLPFTPYGRELAERGHRQGKEIMLHAPMSNEQQLPLGRGGLYSGMSQVDFLAVLASDLADIPHVQGVNNHTGSQLTREAEPMAWLMAELKRRQLYFVDSRTTAKTLAEASAQAIGLAHARRDVFLDHSQAPEHIARQLQQALRLAKRNGSAIAIGHPHPETLKQLEMLPSLLASEQVQLVHASALMKQEKVAPATAERLVLAACGAPPVGLWYSPWMAQNPFAAVTGLLPLWRDY